MRSSVWLLSLLFFLTAPLSGREFTVLVYNVENLFDVDGVALFGDYDPQSGSPYGTEHLINKLEAVRRVLVEFNDGAGPEVILFQEFELDRTPFGTPEARQFLADNQDRDLRQVLAEERSAANLPVELLLLKYLEDHGLRGYHIAQPDTTRMEQHAPHKNVVFSRFPIESVRQRPKLQARDLLVVTLDVEGHDFVLLNNHWKSGASASETEPIRVQNAHVVRAEVERLLIENPAADVLIGGDLNCYYNHKAVFPELPQTAVNDILGAHGFESRMQDPSGMDLYNLWFELPPAERGSEVYRGYWGTLMQIIATPGLYDRRGIQYIDNSFDRVILPGENVDTRWGRPVAWSNLGGGAGFSDHLPIYARFRVIEGEGEPGPMNLDQPTDEELGNFRLRVPYERLDRRAIPPVEGLAGLAEAERVARRGELFRIDAEIAGTRPLRIQAGSMELTVFSPVPSVRERLNALQPGDRLVAHADLDDWRGQLQLVIQHADWLFQPAAPEARAR